jgi:hypothetical protein
MKSSKLLICFLVSAILLVQPCFLYAKDISNGPIKNHKEENSGWFSIFDSTDRLLLSGVAFADLADFASSNYMSYVSRKEAQLCSPNVYLCSTPYGSGTPNGEGNPLITGLYGTKCPTHCNTPHGLQDTLVSRDMVGNGYGAGFGWGF